MLHERLHVIDLLPPGSLSVGKTSVTTMQSIISKASQVQVTVSYSFTTCGDCKRTRQGRTITILVACPSSLTVVSKCVYSSLLCPNIVGISLIMKPVSLDHKNLDPQKPILRTRLSYF